MAWYGITNTSKPAAWGASVLLAKLQNGGRGRGVQGGGSGGILQGICPFLLGRMPSRTARVN